MAVFYLTASTCDIFHAQLAEFIEFCVGAGFVVAALVGGGKHSVVFGYYVIFQFAHGFKM